MALPTTVAMPAAAKRKMNVLFIISDDLRTELGCYGNAIVHSPNIDKLAARGFLFKRAYCQQAVSAPSRASFLTGCRPDTTHITDLNHPLTKTSPHLVSFPKVFKHAGYETVSLGKVYHHEQDDVDAWSQTPWHPTGPWKGRGYVSTKAQEELFQREKDLSKDEQKGIGPATDLADVPDTALPDGVIAEKAVQELQRLKDKPFFLAVGFIKPHLPFTAPKKYWDLYSREQFAPSAIRQWPAKMPDVAQSNWGELRAYVGMPKQGAVTDDQARELIHGYHACVSYLDAQVGKPLDELDRLKLRENTIVVLLGDHGWKLSEYAAWCKHTNFELDTHAPLMLQVPGMQGGQQLNHLVEFVDVCPTLAELCGVAAPSTCEGTSLLPLLKNPRQEWKAAAFSQYPRGEGVMGYTMRTDRYRFTEWMKGDQVVARELYDHKDAAVDLVNSADDPACADLVRTLSLQRRNGWKAARPAAR